MAHARLRARARRILAMPLTGTASAHGSVIDPASRNYGCWERWGHDFQNPAMQQQDPMCWQARNWNGLYRDNVGGNHQPIHGSGMPAINRRPEVIGFRIVF